MANIAPPGLASEPLIPPCPFPPPVVPTVFTLLIVKIPPPPCELDAKPSLPP